MDPDERIRRPERKPPFAVTALAKQAAKMIKEITTSNNPFTGYDVGKISRNASIAKYPVRPCSWEPSCVLATSKKPMRSDRK